MNILIVCVNYDDLLAISLPTVRREFPSARTAVITTFEDEATLGIATAAGVTAYRTGAFHRGGAAFNKAAALNDYVRWQREWGLAADPNGWTMTLDADIALPRGFGDVVRAEMTDPACLYGASRLMCPDLRTWREGPPFLRVPDPPQLPGFLHGFWAPGLVEPWYDATVEHAGAYDTFFQSGWPRECRRRFSVPVTHLGPLGQNWFGRRTERWDGRQLAPPPGAEALFRRHEEQRRQRVPVEDRKRARPGEVLA
jgi:hypothetical protein